MVFEWPYQLCAATLFDYSWIRVIFNITKMDKLVKTGPSETVSLWNIFITFAKIGSFTIGAGTR